MKALALVVLCLFGIVVWSADQGTIPNHLAHVFAFPGVDILGHFLIAVILMAV